MSHSALALYYMQKQAGLGRIARFGGNVIRRAWNTPGQKLTVGMGVGLPALIGYGALAGPKAPPDPVKLEKKRQRRLLAQRIGSSSMKIASAGIADSDVRRAIRLGKQIEKTASPLAAAIRDPVTAFTTGAALATGMMVAGMGGVAAIHGVGKATDAIRGLSSERQYKKMLKADPTLKKDSRTRTFFGLVQRASPYIASEPYVAAATVKSMLDSPDTLGAHPRFMKDIMSAEEARQKSRYPFLQVPRVSGAKLPDAGE